MTKIKKILVIGASIAGPAICYWLKKYGFSPTLVEKHDGLRKGGYAIDIRGIAVDVAKKMGIYDDVCKQRTGLQFGRYVDTDGHTLFEEQGEKFGFRQGEEVEIVRGDLVHILMDTIKDVPCYFNRSVKSLVQHDDCVEVTFNDDSKENYDLVIGADGLHSVIRRMVFSKEEYRLVNLGSYISVFSVPNYLHLDHCEMLFEKDQKLVSITSDHNPDISLAAFMFRSSQLLNDVRNEAEQKQFLRDHYRDFGWESNKLLALMDESQDFYFDSITQVKMPDWTKGRIALLGDSGYCASPLSGQGTSLALVGAYIFVKELAQQNDYKLAFERYNELLRPFVEANQAFGAWVSESFLSTEQISGEKAEERAKNILVKMNLAANAIELPRHCEE